MDTQKGKLRKRKLVDKSFVVIKRYFSKKKSSVSISKLNVRHNQIQISSLKNSSYFPCSSSEYQRLC